MSAITVDFSTVALTGESVEEIVRIAFVSSVERTHSHTDFLYELPCWGVFG